MSVVRRLSWGIVGVALLWSDERVSLLATVGQDYRDTPFDGDELIGMAALRL